MSLTKKQLYFFFGQTLIGVIAFGFLVWGKLSGDYTNAMLGGVAGSFILTGVMGIVVSYRLLKNPEKATRMEIAKTEERTVFIRTQANSVAYTVMLYTLSVTTIVAGLFEYETISLTLVAVLIVQSICNAFALHYYSKKY